MLCSPQAMRWAVTIISAEEIVQISPVELIGVLLIAISVIILLLCLRVTHILSIVRLLLTKVYPSFLPSTSLETSSELQSPYLVLPSEPVLEELCIVVRWLATE